MASSPRSKGEEVFTEHYSKLCDTITDVDDLLPHFVQQSIISTNELEVISKLHSRVEKVKKLLSHISGPLQAGNSKGFYSMLSIMEERGVQATRELAAAMRKLLPDSKPEES